MSGGISIACAARLAGVTESAFTAALERSGIRAERRDDADDMRWLLAEFETGVHTGHDKGWLTEDEMDARFMRMHASRLATGGT